MPQRYYTRRFLNRRGHHAGGYVLAAVENTSRRHDERVYTEIDFTIADCGRQVSLSFDVDPGYLANSLYKVDLLIDTLTKFRAALVEEGRLAAERESRLKAQKAVSERTTVPRS